MHALEEKFLKGDTKGSAVTLHENTASHCQLRAAMVVFAFLSLTQIQIVARFLLTSLEMCRFNGMFITEVIKCSVAPDYVETSAIKHMI